MNMDKIQQARGMLSVAIDLAGTLPARLNSMELDITMEHVLQRVRNKLAHADLDWAEYGIFYEALDDGRLTEAAGYLGRLCGDQNPSPRLSEG
jgi:hypothetical protein